MRPLIPCAALFIFLAAAILPAKSPELDAQLLDASAAGDTARVSALIVSGADVNARDSRDPNDKTRLTPLMKAAANGHGEAMKLLMQSGSRINDADEYWGSALGMAAANGHLTAVNELLRAGADPNVTNGPPWRIAPLMGAVQHRRLEAVKALIEAKADVNARGNQGTALNMAITCKFNTAVPLLIKAGADVNSKDDSGNPALVKALKDPELVRLLIEAGADVNARGGGQATILNRAGREGSPEVVKMLLAAGADRDAQSESGDTTLMMAQSGGRADNLAVLLEGKEGAPWLLKSLRAPAKPQRLSALHAAFEVEDRQSVVDAIVALLQEERDEEVRDLANLKLEGVVQEVNQKNDRTRVPLLLRLLEIGNDKLATMVIITLQKLGDQRAIPALRNRFWTEADPSLARGALLDLGDKRYVWWAEHSRAFSGLAVLVFSAIGGLIVEPRKKFWLLRLVMAGASATAILVVAAPAAFFIAMFSWTAGSSAAVEGLGAAAMVSAAYLGAYCAFFAGTATMVRLRNSAPHVNALAIGAVAVLAPLIASYVTRVSPANLEGGGMIVLYSAYIGIVFEATIASALLDRWRARIGELWSERLSLSRFCVFWAVMTGPWLLPRPFFKPLVNAISG